MQKRNEAKSKYSWGNKSIGTQGIWSILVKPDIANILKAIQYYQEALFCLRSIEKAEVIEEDNKTIQDVLKALLYAINEVVRVSSNWHQIMDTLEKFLTLYVDSVKILNKKHQRLPGLDALDFKMGGPFKALTSIAPPGDQLERVNYYLAVISLFHSNLKTERDLKLSSDNAVVTKSFDLYTRALKVLDATVKFEPPVEEEQQPIAVKAVLPPALSQLSTAEAPKKIAAVTSLAPRFSYAQQTKEIKLKPLDYVAPDGPKRRLILEFMSKGKFVEALAAFHKIRTHIADDLRCACECQFEIGKLDVSHNRFIEALMCYKEALRFCRQIQTKDFIELDQLNIAKVFKACVNVINTVVKDWSVNFLLADTCMVFFLNCYLDSFIFLSRDNNRLSGLDEINIDFLISFLDVAPDETFRMKTRIYLTIIRMFRQDAKLEKGRLESQIDQIETIKASWNGGSMLETIDLFDKALALLKSIKCHAVLNPELNAALESKQKRSKHADDSNSSSPIYGFG